MISSRFQHTRFWCAIFSVTGPTMMYWTWSQKCYFAGEIKPVFTTIVPTTSITYLDMLRLICSLPKGLFAHKLNHLLCVGYWSWARSYRHWGKWEVTPRSRAIGWNAHHRALTKLIKKTLCLIELWTTHWRAPWPTIQLTVASVSNQRLYKNAKSNTMCVWNRTQVVLVSSWRS